MGRTVLVIGSGGREHALAHGLAESASVDAVESAPGNPGTAALGPTHDVDLEDLDAVADLAADRGADLVVIGPEQPLVAGLADVLRERDIPVFGPSAAAAEIEGSKTFAKEIMDKAGAPTARYGSYDDPDVAKQALDDYDAPYVVKADGLAGGKGVRICDDLDDARAAIDDAMVDEAFGVAGRRIVIEQFLDGPEVSVFAVTDGEDVVLLSPSQDFKRALDGGEGLNTGGMGAHTPVPTFGVEEAEALRETVFRPVLSELADRGAPYQGLLYAGLVLTDDGPKVLEFNCRFGDPETQVVVPRLSSDLGDLLYAGATGGVGDVDVSWHDDAFVTVVLASDGYPTDYQTGLPITGIEAAGFVSGVTIYHAGTSRATGQLTTAGGRVLDITGRGEDLAAAREAAYKAAQRIIFANKHYRRDIAEAAAET